MEVIHPLQAFREKQTPPMTRAELARLLGVSRETVHRWENGKRDIDRKKLTDITEKTGISPHELRPDLAEIFEEAR